MRPPLLHRTAAAPPARHQRATRPDRAVQRATLPGKPPASRKRELGANAQRSPAARPAVPCRTWTPVNLHGAEGALEERASVLLAVQKRAGALCQQALRSRALRQQATAHVAGTKRAAVGRGGCAAACGRLAEVVAQGGGALGAAVEQSEAAVRARRRQGRAGWVRTLWGRG